MGSISTAVLAIAASAVIPAGQSLADLPNTTIDYYDVSGTDIRQINDSILAQQNDEISTSSADWNMGVSLQTREVDRKCTITGAAVRFSAHVRLPRLTSEKQASREIRAAWKTYLASLEAREAAGLWFVYGQLPRVEQAVRTSSCENAGAAAATMVEKVKGEEAEIMRRASSSQGISQ